MKSLKLIVITILLCGFSLGVSAQKTCSLRIIDDDPLSPSLYSASFTLIWYYNGSYQQVGPTHYYTLPITPNVTNDIGLPWELPVDTQDNIYILIVNVVRNGFPKGPYYSSWFNSPVYYNDKIPVTANM